MACLVQPESISGDTKQPSFFQAQKMEEGNQNAIVDAAAFDSGAGTVPVQNRRTAAIDVLTKALLSPPIQEENDETTTGNEVEASNAVTAAALSARSFLDTTCSVYVLDGSNSIIGANSATTLGTNASATSPNTLGSSHNDNNNDNLPKIFGCWNFLHQAMNEIERFEDEQNHLAATNGNIKQGSQPALLSETRLLAEFAVKVARRSDDLDRQKVATCVENFCGSNTSSLAGSGSSSSLANAGGKENANIGDSSGNASNNNDNDTNDSQPDRNQKSRLDVNQNNNESNSGGSNHDIHVLLPHLVRANAEIREIVTGRIAAFSFNGGQPTSPLSMPNPTATTAFADPQVVETFCRFLAANAVSNGPERLRRFLNDWIIPGATVDATSPSSASSNSPSHARDNEGFKRPRLSPGGSPKRLLQHRLPPYSLACVLYHVAAEAEMVPSHDSDSTSSSSTCTARTISPLGTIDVLQRLSLPVIANVLLGPVLHDALQRKQLKRQLKQHRQHLQQQQQAPPPSMEEEHEDDMDDRIIAMGFRAILKWCSATDLSLAQAKHIGSKVQVNLSRLIGEALQTDSPRVMSALADLIEDVAEQHVVPLPPPSPQQARPKRKHRLISESRMTQTRYLMQVPDEASFRANVSEEQLHTIETKELSDILSELTADVEGLRFRFPSFGREAATGKGSSPKKPLRGDILLDDDMHSLGHSLARITAALCLGYYKVTQGDNTVAATANPGPYQIPGSGVLDLLSKCASHPSVSICGIVLPVITPVLKTEAGLATQWLPTLQRRAIIPHHPNSIAILSSSANSEVDKSDGTYIPLLSASDICFVEFDEFVDRFRETVLSEALNACYSINPEYYLASCTAAIEEFCVGDVVTEQTSFHLEAALFCMAVVAEQVLPGVIIIPTGARAISPNPGTKQKANVSTYLLRCTAALAKKPKSLNNPLTMAQASRFMRKYAKWFGSNQHQGILDIAADLTLYILVQCATPFIDTPLSSTIQKETGLTPFSEATKTLRCLLCNNSKHFLSNKAIAALGAGWEATFAACNRSRKLLTLEDRKDTCIGICHVLAALPNDQQQTSLMALALASIACLEAMVERAQALGPTGEEETLSPMLDRAADEIIILVTTAKAFSDAISTINSGVGSGAASFVESSMVVLERAWPTISIVASKYSYHDTILESLRFLFVECMSKSYNSKKSLAFLRKICALAQEVIKNETARQKNNRFFSPVLDFLDEFVQMHGATLEKIVLSKQSSGGEAQGDKTYTDEEEKMYKCVDSLARETIQAMTSLNILGSTWTSAQTTQGNGQSASETKSKQPLLYKRADICSSGLAPFFSFLRTCTMRCPAFLLHALEPEGDEGDGTNDSPGLLILRKALNTAVSSVIDVEAEISIRAMSFLESMASLAANNTETGETSNSAIRRAVMEYNLPFETSMLSVLLRGSCGMLQPFVISYACHLLFHALSKSSLSEEELKVIVLRGLSQDHFFLGNRARSVVYEFCLLLLARSNTDATANPPTLEGLENMMADIWRLHRFENVDTIEQSDAVHAFCTRHGRKKLAATTSASP